MPQAASHPPHRILVCFAVKQELRPFSAFARRSNNISTCLTGMGASNAEKHLLHALSRSSPTMVLSCGFAGGLNPSLRSGCIVYDADPALAISDRLQQLGGVHAEFSSIDWIITSSEAKHKLHYASGADAVDMESAVIRRICKDNNIPSANIRAILDTANENLPLDFNKHKTDEFNLNYRGIALDILNNPSSIKNLIAFGIRAESVARKLSKYLERLLISFC